MKIITPLTPSEQSVQLATFVDFFVKEFMSEIWYLEESARGNIPGREEASIGTLFNVACGLASLVPIPGSVIAMVASHKLIVASMKLAAGITEAVRESEWGSRVLAVAEVAKSTWDGYGEQAEDIALAQGAGAESAGLDGGQAVDTESLAVLARWLGHQLAQRYEQALTERLSTEPEAAIMGLARVGARRSLAFLTDNGGMTGTPQERTERLLAGVVQGKPMNWYERPLKWFAKGQRLVGRDGLAKEKFTAERLYVNGGWTSLTDAGMVCHTHSGTEWFNAKTCVGQPKYGYVSGHIEEPALKPHEGETPGLPEWLARRVFQPVTIEQLGAYLSSPVVLAARDEKTTATQSLNDFLSEHVETFPKHGQAVFHGDLTALDLSSGNFCGSDFSGTQITGDLSNTRFDGALLYATQWHKVLSVPGSQISFARAQLGFSEMAGANFQGDVDVTQADLSCVNLTGASFGAVQQVGTKWYKANLTGVEYEGIAKAQREQLTLVTAKQTAQAERFKALNDKVAILEAQVKPLLDGLAAKQPVGAGAGAGGAVPEAQRQAMEQQQVLEDLLAAQEKRIQFEAYCEEKLAQLTVTSKTHTGQIATLEANLKRIQEASAQGQAALQCQVDQLSKRVSRVESRVDGLARRSSVIKLKVDDLTSKLSQLHILLEEQRGLAISKDLSPADREAILEKSAISKMLDVYCSNLSQRQKDLHYYVRPDVIERIPDRMTPDEYMLGVEEGKLEDNTVPLLDEVDAYLRSDDSVMLLLGEPGAGKSLFAWYGSQSRLPHYQMVLQDREPSETPWLPIVIELKNYRLSELTRLLPKYLHEVCHLGTEELAAIQNDQKPAHKLLVVLDGFDELKQDADYDKNLLADLFQACGAQDWYAGQAKLVVTCRVRELPDAYTERQYFGHGIKKDYRRRTLLPFSQQKISDYLDERTKAGASRDLELLTADEYLQALKASDSVKEMVRNPFVLRLFVEALPGLVKAGINLKQIKRYDIYHGFVKQWFEREVNRLDVAHRKTLGVDSEGVRNIAASFERYAGILAVEMYRQDTLVVSYNEDKQDDPAFEVWSRMDEVVAETDIDEEGIKAKLAERYRKLKATDKRKLQIKEKIKTEADYVAKYLDAELDSSVDHVTAQLEAFKMTSPLRQAGDQYSFIHKSFYEYFMASQILSSAGADKPLPERVSSVLALLNAEDGNEQRRLWQEPEALDFVCEYWPKALPEEKARLKETWFAVIEATKGHPEHGVAGANAGTLLNWVNVSFTYKDWRDIQMPAVDLRSAYLEGTDLRGANLSGAWLGKIQAGKVDMRGANLTNTKFSQLPAVSLDHECMSVSYHPRLPIVAAGYGKLVRLYHFGENRWLHEPFAGHTENVVTVAFSPDGMWVASGSEDNTVRQWVVASGEPRGKVLEGHPDRVTCLSYSPDGKLLVSGCKDGTIRQWDAMSDSLLGKPFFAHKWGVKSVSYSPDGKWVASGGGDHMIRQWEVTSGDLRSDPIERDSSQIESISYSPDGEWLACGGRDGHIQQWHAASGTSRGAPFKGHTDLVTSICYSPDGKWLASGSWDGTIRQWDAASGELRGVPLSHTAEVYSVTYSSDGNWLVSGSEDCTIRQWEAESEEHRGAPQVGHVNWVRSARFSPGAKWLVSGGDDGRIRQWSLESGGLLHVFQGSHMKILQDLCFSPDGKWLACGSDDGKVQLWDMQIQQCRDELIDAGVGEIFCLNYSPDGKWLAIGGEDGIQRWDVELGEPHGEPLDGHTGDIRSLVYSPDSKWLVSGSDDRTIRQWDAVSGEDSGVKFLRHFNCVQSVNYSPDGIWIVSGSDDKTIRQWQAASGKSRGKPLAGHTGGVSSVTYTPNGKLIVSGSDDKTVRLWNAESGECCMMPLYGHSDMCVSVECSADGHYILSAAWDGTVRLWQCPDNIMNGGAAPESASIPDENSYDNEETCQLRWGTKSSLMQLSAQSLWLSGAIGLDAHQLELLRQHGYEGKVNVETGLIEDDNPPPDDIAPAAGSGAGAAVTPAPVTSSPAAQAVPVGPVAVEVEETHDAISPDQPQAASGASSPAPAVSATEEPKAAASPIRTLARQGSDLLLLLAPILKRSKFFSPTHKLRDQLVPIYKDPINFENTYVSADMLRSADLGLTEKQLCKFARVNLNAARESSSVMQVKDALDLFEALVGKEKTAVCEKVARVVGVKKQTKYYTCLLFGRAHLAELSTADDGSSAGVAASPTGK